MDFSSARHLVRRVLLRVGVGAAALSLLWASTLARAAAERGSAADVDYPNASWTPAANGNFRAANRPTGSPINLVIIHTTEERYDDAIAIFQDPKRRTSAHYVVRSADGFITQMVREHDIAYHAGSEDHNARSIGIEHEAFVADPKWYTDAMYRSSAALTRAVCDRYGIPKDRAHIIGHNEVPGTTHTDPGKYWDWDKYLKLVNGR